MSDAYLKTAAKQFSQALQPYELEVESVTYDADDKIEVTVIASPSLSNEESYKFDVTDTNSQELAWGSDHQTFQLRFDLTAGSADSPEVKSAVLKGIKSVDHKNWNNDGQDWKDAVKDNIIVETNKFLLDSFGIPDSVVNRAPLDEGSGTSFADIVGDATGSLDNGGTWTTDTAFEGDTAPTFDQNNAEGGSWDPRTTAPVTFTMRVRADPNGLQQSDGTNHIFRSGTGTPRVAYINNSDEWYVETPDGSTSRISEAQSALEGSIRIVAFRLDSAEANLDIYDSDATTKIGSTTITNPGTSFSSTTINLLRSPGSGSVGSSFGDVIDLIDAHDAKLSDSELDSTVQEVYG